MESLPEIPDLPMTKIIQRMLEFLQEQDGFDPQLIDKINELSSRSELTSRDELVGLLFPSEGTIS